MTTTDTASSDIMAPEAPWPLNKKIPGVRYGQRLVPQVIDERARSHPDHLFARIAKSTDISQGFHELTISQLANAINWTAYWLEGQIGRSEDFEVVALLGIGDFRYWIFEIAAIKCGYVANHIAILEKTKCKKIFYVETIANRVADMCDGHDYLQKWRIPEIEEMMSPSKVYPYTKTWEEAQHDRVLIVHTSGSTGTPKPIYYSNFFLAVFDSHRNIPSVDGRPPCGLHLYGDAGNFFTAFPFFHLAGLSASLVPIWYEATYHAPPPERPATGRLVIDIMAAVGLDTMFCPPVIMEDMVREYLHDFFKYSGSLKAICYGGGPLAPAAGNLLAERILVGQGIGCSETGMLPNVIPERADWQWFQWHPTHSGTRMEPMEGTDLYELVCHRDPALAPFQACFELFPDLQEFRTRDLFSKHPTRDLWVYVGRRDDVIVLSNGEKFNPVTMELIITGSSLVSGSLVVGLRQPRCGLLVEVYESVDVTNPDKVIDEIWPNVQKANSVSPGHGQISRDMIRILNDAQSPEKRFPRASKGTIIRFTACQQFSQEIDDMFKEDSGQTALEDLPKLSEVDGAVHTAMCALVRQLVALSLKGIPEDTSDLFSEGVDSLMCARLTNDLKNVLKGRVPEKKISVRMIYENPSIAQLATALQQLLFAPQRKDSGTMDGVTIETADTKEANGATNSTTSNDDSAAVQRMKAMVDKLAKGLPTQQASKSHERTSSLSVVVTGTTGFLGQFLLDALIQDPQFGKIYCLNRSKTAKDKFTSHSNHDISNVEFLQVTFGEPRFGLEESVFEKLRESVDVIIHNAWQLDFNLTLESFEKPHLLGVRTFIDWTLSSSRQPALFYVSSASSLGAWSLYHPDDPIPEELPLDSGWKYALPMGYAESKHVSERLLQLAAAAGAKVNILRSGQIAGPTPNSKGVWTPSEWFPTLVRSSKALKRFPRDIGGQTEIDWIPCDVLAQVIVEIASSRADAQGGNLGIYNLVNPQHTKLRLLLDTVAETCGGEVVGYDEWLKALQSLDPNDAKNLQAVPALKLMDFFRGLGQSKESFMRTENGERDSRTMAGLQSLQKDVIRSWMKHW